MRSIRHRIGVSLTLALLASVIGCAQGKEPGEGPTSTNRMSFEEFEARTYREPGTGVYIVAGDTPIQDREALRRFFDEYMQQGALTVHTEGGVDAKWDDTQKLNLGYCVSQSFGVHYADVVSAMEIAVDDWESSANVNFIHLSNLDASCDASTPDVVFDVSPAPNGSPYLARAFFPNFPRSERNILIAAESFQDPYPYTLAGILKHETGHTLGFRHEHTRPEAGVCYEDSNWRALTGYDAASVMHYPFCNGTNTADLLLTPIDRDGAAGLYGGHPICITVQEGVSGASFDAHISSKKPNKNYDEDEIESGDKKNDVLGLLKFDLSGIPSAARVQSATVTLHEKTGGKAGDVEVHNVTAPWSESTVTFASFGGAYASEVLASFATPAGGHSGFVSFDATALAKLWVNGQNNGLLLAESGDRTRFKSSEANAVTKRPRLDLCYLPPASPPPAWTCAPEHYGTGDGCDCNCGFADLDCFQPDQPVKGCAPGEMCTSRSTCRSVPAGWTCSPDSYDALDACNCNCGAYDPDCDNPWNWVTGCSDWTYTCDENGQCVPPVCGDGKISGYEECDPPDGVTCDANCHIIRPPESSCNDLSDEDWDGLYDCQDPDCKALGVCTPGPTPTGGACAEQTDCQANDTDPFCIDEPRFGWGGGYCTEFCDVFANDCAGDGVCLDVGIGVGLCFDGCQSNADCRPGYGCSDTGFGAMACSPAPEICDNGVDDNNNGLADCADPSCHYSPACAVCGDGEVTGNETCDPPDGVTCDASCHIIYPPESACNDFYDNDFDGLYDCQDPDCKAAGQCDPGPTPLGGACAAQTECQANDTDPFCINDSNFGWSGGYCTEFCDVAQNDCPGDGFCADVGLGWGFCLDGCQSNADCRPGYGCSDIGTGVLGCVPGQEVCDNGADDDNDGQIDCADPSCHYDPACAVCGDGEVTGNETCDPPDGVTCDASCQIIYGPESFCDNLLDEDQDGLFDCQDPDCQALGVCTPGATPTGGACTSMNECAANANDPFCISEASFGWPGGYCTEYCDYTNDDCPGVEACLPISATAGLCLAGCQTDADCRAGYVCQDFGYDTPVCMAP